MQKTIRAMCGMLSMLVLAGCGGSDSPVSVASECSLAGQQQTLYEIMHDAYLWYDKVPQLDYTAYGDLSGLLEALKYHTYDKWSYITTESSYDDYFEEGTYIGYGFSLSYSNGHAYLKFVYPDSPAYRAGFRRGTEIVAINGYTVEEIVSRQLWDSIYGESEIGVASRFEVIIEGKQQEITLYKEKVTAYSVLHESILERAGKKIGYLVFNAFIEPSEAELKEVFTEFESAGVEALIVDLRYNGGGRIHIAQYLASLIAGEKPVGEIVASLIYNDRYTGWNENYLFEEEAHSLNLEQVYLITTEASCSASELLINGLKPFMEVSLVGSRTCGKPVGMRGYSFCDMHLAPIQFEVFNAENSGRYYEGLPVHCAVEDDLMHRFGDSEEKMLAETLLLMETGACSKTTKHEKRTDPDGETETLTGWQREIGAI